MNRVLSFFLLFVLVLPLAAFQIRCPGSDPQKAARTAEEQFAALTDRSAEYIGRGLSTTELMVDTNLITKDRGRAIVEALEAANNANEALIKGAQQFVKEVDGKRILRFDEAGRLELERLAKVAEDAAIAALNSPALRYIDYRARSQLLALMTPARIAATKLVNLIKNAKNITVANPGYIEIELSYGRSIEMGGVDRLCIGAI